MNYFLRFLLLCVLSFSVDAASICYKRGSQKLCALDMDLSYKRTIILHEVKHDNACNPSDDCYLEKHDKFEIGTGGAAIWYRISKDANGNPILDQNGKPVYVKKKDLTFSLISKEHMEDGEAKVIHFLKDTSEGYDIFVLFRGSRKCGEIDKNEYPPSLPNSQKDCKLYRFEIFSQGFSGEKPDTAKWEPMANPIEPDTGGGHEPP